MPPARAVRPADAARARSELAEIGEVRWQPAAGGRRESLRSAGETALQALRGTLGRNSREARVARLPTSMEPPDDGGLCVICLEGAAERSPRDAPAPGGNVHGRAVRGRWQSEAELYRGAAERPAPSRRASARELGGAPTCSANWAQSTAIRSSRLTPQPRRYALALATALVPDPLARPPSTPTSN